MATKMNLLKHSPGFSLSIVGLCCLLWLLAGCSASTDTTVPQTSAQGVTDTKILLGSSLALKGHASFLGSQTLRGASCYLNYVNSLGGVHGRTIDVIAHDDSYDPLMCLTNTQRLIIDDRCSPFSAMSERLQRFEFFHLLRKPGFRFWECSLVPMPLEILSTAG